MSGKYNINAGFMNLQISDEEAAANEKKKAAIKKDNKPKSIAGQLSAQNTFDPRFIDAGMENKYLSILNALNWTEDKNGDVLSTIPERFFAMLDEVSDDCRFSVEYDRENKQYLVVSSAPDVFCGGQSLPETRALLRQKISKKNRLNGCYPVDKENPKIVVRAGSCADRTDPAKNDRVCGYYLCPMQLAVYLAYLKATGKEDTIKKSRTKYGRIKDEIDLDNANPWYFMNGVADFVFRPYGRDYYVPNDKLAEAREFLDKGLYTSKYRPTREGEEFIYASYDSTYKRMHVQAFDERDESVIPYSDLVIESRPAESTSRHKSGEERARDDAMRLATERDFRQFAPCPYCDNDFCEIKYAAFVDMLIQTGEYAEYCDKSREFEKAHKDKYRLYAEEVPELNELANTIEIQNNFYGCVSGSTHSHTQNIANAIAREITYKPCVSPNIAHMTMVEFLEELRTRDYYKKVSDYLVPHWGTPAKNQVYILNGIEEYLKEVSIPEHRSAMLHLVEVLSNVNDNRYFILTGTDVEVDNLLSQFIELENVFSISRIRIKDMTAPEIYDAMLDRLSSSTKNEINEEFKNRVIEYISLNQGVIPYNNKAMARYLAAYINRNGLKLPSLNKVDVEKALDEMIGMQEIKDKLREFESFTVYKKKLAARGSYVPSANTHMAFLGNPGTGKTTVARIVAQMMFNIGLLRKNTVVEVQRKDLIAEYVGHTAIKTQEVIDKAMGGVLFIDEAYSLTAGDQKQDFGGECVATLIKAMEDHKDDLIVIFAGYVNEMNQFMSSNPGLQSRIGYVFNFKDYEPEELAEMFVVNLQKNGYVLEEGVEDKVEDIARYFKESDDFGNGRFIDSLIQDTIVRHSITANEDNLMIISNSDVPEIEDLLKTKMKGWEMVNPKDISEDELRRIAIHELGHAVAGYYLSGNLEIEKISVQADASGTLGFVQYDRKRKALTTEEDLLNNVAMTLAGKNAEDLVLGSHSEGCSNDVSKAKALSKRMVDEFAMGNWLDEKADIELLRQADQISREVLLEHQDKLVNLADELMTEKSISREKITSFLGKKE